MSCTLSVCSSRITPVARVFLRFRQFLCHRFDISALQSAALSLPFPRADRRRTRHVSLTCLVCLCRLEQKLSQNIKEKVVHSFMCGVCLVTLLQLPLLVFFCHHHHFFRSSCGIIVFFASLSSLQQAWRRSLTGPPNVPATFASSLPCCTFSQDSALAGTTARSEQERKASDAQLEGLRRELQTATQSRDEACEANRQLRGTLEQLAGKRRELLQRSSQ